jgi:hypothetical protein
VLFLSAPAAAPVFKTLSRQECESVLLRNNVGRIAYAVHDRGGQRIFADKSEVSLETG